MCQRRLFIIRGWLLEQDSLADLRAKYQPTVELRARTDLPLAEGERQYLCVPVRVLAVGPSAAQTEQPEVRGSRLRAGRHQ